MTSFENNYLTENVTGPKTLTYYKNAFLGWDGFWLFVFFASLITRFPFATFNLFGNVSSMAVLDHAATGLIAAGVLLCNTQWFRVRLHGLIYICVGIMSVSALLHIFANAAFSGYGTENQWLSFYRSLDIMSAEGLMFALVPVIACLKFKKVLRLFPYFIAMAWALDIYHCMFGAQAHAYYSVTSWSQLMKDFIAGKDVDNLVSYVGNRNWQAAFLVGAAFPTAWVAYRWASKIGEDIISSRICGWIGAGTVLFISFFFHRLMDSRASVASAVFAAGIVGLAIGLHFLRNRKQLQYKILAAIIVTGTLAVTALFAVKHETITQKLETLSATDVRVPMWRAACTMLKEENPNPRPEVYPPVGYYWLTGVGATHFEDNYVICRMPDYFTRTLPAARTDYPHNNSFYIAGYLGVPAWIAFFILGIIPMTCVFFRIIRGRKVDWFFASLLFGAIGMYFHAHLDLVFEYSPMAAMYLVTIGLFWRAAWPVKYTSKIPGFLQTLFTPGSMAKPMMITGVFFIAGACFLTLGGVHAYRMYRHSFSNLCATSCQHFATIISKQLANERSPEVIRVQEREISSLLLSRNQHFKEAVEWVALTPVAALGIGNAHALGDVRGQRFYTNFIYDRCKSYNYANVNFLASLYYQSQGDLAKEEAALLRQIRASSIGMQGWVKALEFYQRTKQPLKAQVIYDQLEKACAVRGHSVEVGIQYANPITDEMRGYDLRPFYDKKNWKKPDVFPAHDKSLWPDLSFVYRRLGKGTEANLNIDDTEELKASIARDAKLRKARAAKKTTQLDSVKKEDAVSTKTTPSLDTSSLKK